MAVLIRKTEASGSVGTWDSAVLETLASVSKSLKLEQIWKFLLDQYCLENKVKLEFLCYGISVLASQRGVHKV